MPLTRKQFRLAPNPTPHREKTHVTEQPKAMHLPEPTPPQAARTGAGTTPIRAVLLDMDGTLVGSHASVERAWRTWAGYWGVDADEILATSHGRPADMTVREALPQLTDDEVSRAAAQQLSLQYEDLADIAALPGTDVLLAAIAELGLHWAVVTSADRRLAAARLGAAGIAPPVLLTAEDVDRGKPDPAAYLRAAELLGLPPEACLVVEDAEAGVTAGRAAGMRVAGVHGGLGDVPTTTLTEVADWLRREVRPTR